MTTEFQDRQNRTIAFDVDDDSVEAFYQGARIGQFTLRIEQHEPPIGQLVHADVIDLEEKFRGAGIGKEMVRRAFEHHGEKIIPPATYYAEKEQRNSMTQEGMALMRSCQREGWVAEFPDNEKPDGDE